MRSLEPRRSALRTDASGGTIEANRQHVEALATDANVEPKSVGASRSGMLLRLGQIYLAIWVIAVVGYSSSVRFDAGHSTHIAPFDPAFFNVFPALALMPVWILSLVLSMRHAGLRSVLGRSLAAMSIGGMMWSIGTIFFLYYGICSRLPGGLGCAEGYFPYPSPPDVIFPLGTAIASVGVIGLARLLGARSRDLLKSIWLIVPVAALTALAMAPPVSWLGPLSGELNRFAAHSTLGQSLAGAWYMVADITLLSVVVIVVYHGRRLAAGRFFIPLGILLVSMVVIYAMDSAYIAQVGAGTYMSGGMVDMGYGIGDALLALAILRCVHIVISDSAMRPRSQRGDDCETAVLAIIDAHERAVGPLAHEIARTVSGIEITADGTIGEVREPETALAGLVHAYRTAFGHMGTRVSARAAFLASASSPEVRRALTKVIPENDLVVLASRYEPLEDERSSTMSMLAAVHRRNQQMLNSVGDGIIGFDSHGCVISSNPAAQRMLNRTAAALELTTYRDVFTNRNEDGGPTDASCVTTDGRIEGEMLLRRADGSEFPAQFTSTPLMDGIRRDGYVISFRDLSHLREVDRMKGEFIAIVSHELRTPLTSLRAALGLFPTGALGELNERGQKMTALALRSTERLMRLVSDILDLQRLNQVDELDWRGVDINDLVRECVAGIVEAGQETAGRFALSLDESCAVRVHPDRIMQTISNVIGNALKFSPPESVVSIGTRLCGGAVEISIRDQGCGIRDGDQERVFDQFFQSDSSDTRAHGGTGLGLAICARIVEQHGGRISVTSELGSGSCFVITLPALTETALAITSNVA